jgi:hypothetical protein
MIERALKPKRRWPGVVLAVGLCAVVLCVALVVYVLAIQGPSVPPGPIRLVRGADGRLAPAEAPEPQAGLSLSAFAAATRSTDSLSSTSSTVSSDSTRFACRRILILDLCDHLLMQRVGPRLLEHLANLDAADQVDYVPGGDVAEAGGPAPDVIITLDMPSVHESGALTERKLTATIVCTAGTGLAAGRSSTIDNMTPPSLSFQWTATLDHESVTNGIVPRSAKFAPQADDIARQLGDALVKLLNGYSEKYGPMPELPAAFYPSYEPAGPLPFLDGYALEPIASWHGLMASNDSYWRLSAPAGAAGVLRDIRQKMQAAGWRVSAPGKDEDPSELRATQADAVLGIFPADKPAALYVHYVRRMPRPELEHAIDATLTAATPTDALMLFSKNWSAAQRTRALDLLSSRPLPTADACLSLAEMCQGAGRNSQARDALARAGALMLVSADTGELATRARGIARRLGAEKTLDAPPTRATMEAAGFTELTPNAPPLERELGLDQQALFYVSGPDGRTSAVGLSVVRAAQGACQIAYVESANGGKSWGRTGQVSAQQQAQQSLLNGRAEATVARKPGQDRFTLTARLLPGRP